MRRGMRGARAKVVFAVLTLLATVVVGCNALLDFDGFKYDPKGTEAGGDTGPADGDIDGGGDGGCIDPTGFGGKGCYRCTPTTNDELLAACTTSQFETFDNQQRIAGFDPKNPKPALVDGGPAKPLFDAGAVTPTDAGVTPVAPDCVFTGKIPIMVLGATGFPMETIQQAMGSAATIFYSERGSCDGVATMITQAPKVSGEVFQYDPSSGQRTKCSIPAGTSYLADIGLSGLFAESCGGQSGLQPQVQFPADLQDLLGPVNPVMFVVPNAPNHERAISAEAGYKVYGFGSASGVTPWIDEDFIFRRRPSSANQQTIALTLGMPVDALRGVDSNGSSNMKVALQQSQFPAKTIGISSSEIVDPARNILKTLAYKHYNQPVAFYPDSDPATFDRRNVRDGHYFMWIPLHAIVRQAAGDVVAASNPDLLTASGATQSQRDGATKQLAFVMVSRQAAPVTTIDLFASLKTLGNVPQCAMTVTRAKEGAPLKPFKPTASCDCAFEASPPGNTRPECTRCKDASECKSAARPNCSFGFCEP